MTNPNPAERKDRARNQAIAGTGAGIALMVSGIAYILAGPPSGAYVNSWFSASVVVGACLVLLSVVSYFTYMEHQDAAGYAHEATAPTYEGERG